MNVLPDGDPGRGFSAALAALYAQGGPRLIEIARRIGAPWAEFPGTHMEFLRHPARFAAALRVLATQLHSRDGDVPALWNGAAQ